MFSLLTNLLVITWKRPTSFDFLTKLPRVILISSRVKYVFAVKG